MASLETDFNQLSPLDLRSKALVFAFQAAAVCGKPTTAALLIEDARKFIDFIQSVE